MSNRVTVEIGEVLKLECTEEAGLWTAEAKSINYMASGVNLDDVIGNFLEGLSRTLKLTYEPFQQKQRG